MEEKYRYAVCSYIKIYVFRVPLDTDLEPGVSYCTKKKGGFRHCYLYITLLRLFFCKKGLCWEIFFRTPFSSFSSSSFFWTPLTCFSKLPKKGREFSVQKIFFSVCVSCSVVKRMRWKTVKECENREKRNPPCPSFFFFCSIEQRKRVYVLRLKRV